jgi:hypothetical protein
MCHLITSYLEDEDEERKAQEGYPGRGPSKRKGGREKVLNPIEEPRRANYIPLE